MSEDLPEERETSQSTSALLILVVLAGHDDQRFLEIGAKRDNLITGHFYTGWHTFKLSFVNSAGFTGHQSNICTSKVNNVQGLILIPCNAFFYFYFDGGGP